MAGTVSKAPSRLWIVAPVILLLLAVVATQKDVEVSRYLAAHPLPSDLNTVFRLAEAFGHFYGVAAIVLSVAIVCKSVKLGVRLGLIVGAGGLAANVVKLLVGRQRPYALSESLADQSLPGFIGWIPVWLQDAIPWGHAVQSFPSGHSATAAALAFGLSRLWPHASPWFAFLMVAACGQRMVAQAHFLSDVLAGIAVGFTAAYLASLRLDLRAGVART